MIRVEYPNNQVVNVDEKEFMLSLQSNDGNEIIYRKQYKGFVLVVRSIVLGEIISYFNGYIKHSNKEINQILLEPEVEQLTHYGWTGGFNGAIGFDCMHCYDIGFNFSPKYLKELAEKLNFNVNFFDKYSSELSINREESTFKSKEFVFDKLYKIADKALEIYNQE